MFSIASWLVARPHNAVLALAATLLLPLLQIVSGAVLVLLVLKQGLRTALLEAAAAGLLLVVISLLVRAPVDQVVTSMLVAWLPAVVVAVILGTTRSLTLTLQVSAILAAVSAVGFQLLVGDIVQFWQPVLELLVEWSRENNLQLQAEFLASQPLAAAQMMTLAAVLTRWTIVAVYVLLGYRLYCDLPGESAGFGLFRDLNFGRVIAVTMAVASLIAFATGVEWMQHLAVILLAVFWLQGLAIIHWLHAEGRLPLFVVIATYLLMLVLHVFLILALAVLGYIDAVFGFRRKARAT